VASSLSDSLGVLKSVAANPQILRARPAVLWFLMQYMGKFKVKAVDGNFVIHSHLPPLNSPAYRRFIDEHLLPETSGPSHAQVGLTNLCPQRCGYCYNRKRSGAVMTTETIEQVIADLKKLGVFWLGFTGGEPLLNRDIVRITERAAVDCTVKLFTTGSTLTPQLAVDLRRAGMLYVSVSLDHWEEKQHDRSRNFAGAYRTALAALDIFRNAGMHVSVSAVLSREMIRNNETERLVDFLAGLGVHEAWLSEMKPSTPEGWGGQNVITDDDRMTLVRLQDRLNREGRITVNYLGHFEGREHFGCTAGDKMVYVDAFGEVGPCVFIPLSHGNVMHEPVATIYERMRRVARASNGCFINRNYGLIRDRFEGTLPIKGQVAREIAEQAAVGPPARFFELHNPA
jgi:MoaA/NifB/PqqE/SkfB family radical SAM enzyme